MRCRSFNLSYCVRQTSALTLALIFTLICVELFPTSAQQRRRARPSANEAARRPREEEQRQREQAIAIVRETIEAASLPDDSVYSARILAVAADVLWSVNQTEARTVFRRAWEAATIADRAEQEAEQSEITSIVPPVTATREEVLTAIARRDNALTDEFLRILIGETIETQATTEARGDQTQNAPPVSVWRTPSPLGLQRLALASQLLREGQDGRASEIVRPLVMNEGVSGELIAFLLRLRERNAMAADALFLTLIVRTTRAGIEQTTANDVLLLSSYICSPQLLVVVDANGALQFRSIAHVATPAPSSNTVPPVVAPNARGAFYRLAARVLGQPVPHEATQSETLARYVAIERLLPFFEREATSDGAMLRAQRDVLLSNIDATRRDALAAGAGTNSFASERSVDPLSGQMNRLAQARDPVERDRLRTAIIRIAARRKLWLRARSTADEIEDAALKGAAKSFIVAQQIAALSDAFAENDANDYERAAQFVERAEGVAPLVRAWGFAQAAGLAMRRNNRARALELATEAAMNARRAATGTPQHVAALVVATRTMWQINRERAWELLRETVRAINATEDFAGDETEFEIGGEVPEAFAEEEFLIAAEAFRFDEIFALSARADFAQSLAEARIIEDARTSAFAKLAIARIALDGRGQAASDTMR